jgi:hypothetical protein
LIYDALARAIRTREELIRRGKKPEDAVFVLTPEEYSQLSGLISFDAEADKRQIAGIPLVVM